MFGKKKRRRRRSEVRLGTQAIEFETTTSRPLLSVTPAVKFWQANGAQFSGFALLLLLGWALYALFTSAVFYVYGAEIEGNEAVSAREIYLAGQVDSQSVFWLHPVKVAAQIESLPNIKTAVVSISLPARLRIEVTERRPQLLWQTGETVWWVDEEGVVVPSKTEVEGMLRIIDDDLQPLEIGYQIDSEIIKGAQTLRILVPDVKVVRHTRAQGLIVSTPEGWPVYLGDGTNMKAKLVVLSALLPDLRDNETEPSYIDIRNPLQPVYRILPKVQIEPPSPVRPIPAPLRRFPPPRWGP